MNGLQHLAVLDLEAKRQKYPNVPDRALVKSKFEDRTTNGLTKAVIRCLELHNCYVTRVQSQGQYNPILKKWTFSTTKRGTADIHAVVNGQHVSVEIKTGKDRLSNAQKATANQVRSAGGVYLVVGNYETFWAWFSQFANIEKGVLPDAP